MIKHALDYARKGYLVFPAHSSGEKKSHKAARHSNGARWGATTNARHIKRDFEKWPDANIGIATGSESGVFVLDVDTEAGHKKDGVASLRKLEKQYGKLPKTLMARTPSGGLHYYFKHPGSAVTSHELPGYDGLDIKGDGGMVLAPPSARPGVGEYEWLNENPVAEAPQWLIDLVSDGGDADADLPLSSEPQADIDRVRLAADVLPNDHHHWEYWNKWGMVIHAATGGSDEGFKVFDTWSQQSAKYDAGKTRDKWEAFKSSPPTKIGAGSLFREASRIDPDWDAKIDETDFYAHRETTKFFFVPIRAFWPAAGVDAEVPPKTVNGKKIKASTWITQKRGIHQITWAPGKPEIIRNKKMEIGGLVDHPGVVCFNAYRKPTIKNGVPAKAKPYIALVKKLYPDDCEHILDYFAQRVQRPDVKPSHALVLGGSPGIGKDTIIDGLTNAVGPWNSKSITPDVAVKGDFNPWARAVVIRVNEVHPQSSLAGRKLFNTMKIYQAAPPHGLYCNEKQVGEQYVLNVCSVIYTTNYKQALYLEHDDRRHYVAWSECKAANFKRDYWKQLYRWLEDQGGYDHVAAYLATRNIKKYDPKAAPKKTAAFWEAVDAQRSPEEVGLKQVIDKLRKPKALTLNCLRAADKEGTVTAWLKINKNIASAVSNLLGTHGYVMVPNRGNKQNLWPINGAKPLVYARAELSESDRLKAVLDLKYEKELQFL